MRRWLLLATAGALAAGCGSPAVRPAATPAGSDLRQVAVTGADLRGLAASDTAFGAALLRRVQADTHGNIVLSPASIATALQMAFAGARGKTAAEMAATLHLHGVSPGQVAAAASRLLAELAPLPHDKDELLDLVNTVWVQSGLRLTPSYDAMMRTGFGAGLRRTDFRDAPDAARRAVNAAVAEATRQRIRDLISAGQIDSATRLVLTNAVYLKAQWAQPFQPSQTVRRPFDRGDGTQVPVQTMAQQSRLAYAAGRGYQAVRLPYAGGRLTMTVVVPTGTDTDYPAHLAPFREQMVDLWLPKFRFTWAKELSDTLGAMGMPTAFTNGDFTGMTTDEPVQMSFVQHKAFVDVDENGTEAAAATAIGMAVSGAFAPVHPLAVHADHPFYFSISDTKTSLLLFLGRVADPAAS